MSRPRGYNHPSPKDLEKEKNILSKSAINQKDAIFLDKINKKRHNSLFYPLSESAKKSLVEKYGYLKYEYRSISVEPEKPSIVKGVYSEAEALNIISSLDGIEYQKPKQIISNDYLVGIADGIHINKSKMIEIKTSWSFSTFAINRMTEKLSPKYWYQAQGYMELYDVPKAEICFVLINTPKHLIEQEKAILYKKYVTGEINSEKFEHQYELLNDQFNFSKIPLKKRVIRFEVERYPPILSLIYDKVEKARDFMNDFERRFVPNKKIITSHEQYLNIDAEEDNIEHNTPESLQGD